MPQTTSGLSPSSSRCCAHRGEGVSNKVLSGTRVTMNRRVERSPKGDAESLEMPRAPARVTTSFAFSYVERALQESLATRKFGRQEMQKVVAFFAVDPVEC